MQEPNTAFPGHSHFTTGMNNHKWWKSESDLPLNELHCNIKLHVSHDLQTDYRPPATGIHSTPGACSKHSLCGRNGSREEAGEACRREVGRYTTVWSSLHISAASRKGAPFFSCIPLKLCSRWQIYTTFFPFSIIIPATIITAGTYVWHRAENCLRHVTCCRQLKNSHIKSWQTTHSSLFLLREHSLHMHTPSTERSGQPR